VARAERAAGGYQPGPWHGHSYGSSAYGSRRIDTQLASFLLCARDLDNLRMTSTKPRGCAVKEDSVKEDCCHPAAILLLH
jgi:hypothetical protein